MRKLNEQNIRKLGKTNKSYHITLPVSMVRELDWQKNQKLTVRKRGSKLIIEDWEDKK